MTATKINLPTTVITNLIFEDIGLIGIVQDDAFILSVKALKARGLVPGLPISQIREALFAIRKH